MISFIYWQQFTILDSKNSGGISLESCLLNGEKNSDNDTLIKELKKLLKKNDQNKGDIAFIDALKKLSMKEIEYQFNSPNMLKSILAQSEAINLLS